MKLAQPWYQKLAKKKTLQKINLQINVPEEHICKVPQENINTLMLIHSET